MNNDYRRNSDKSYHLMRRIYNITMSIFLLGMSSMMFFGEKWNIPQIIALEITTRYLFGGTCLLYGSFRLYQGIKSPEKY